MSKLEVIQPAIETAFLVGLSVRGADLIFSIEDSLQELARLAKTAGMEVLGSTYQVVNQIDPATFIGKGKVDEIVEIVLDLAVNTVIFDDELSPRHQRELEKRFGQEIKVLDRSALILDIFAQHAQTREGSLQVELAQYEYRLPRLTRQWTHLARQAGGGVARGGSGGVGLRGPGETQLEVDRREISRKISKLRADLENVRQHRGRYRSQRRKTGIPVISLVGYTNAGKSTLLNVLTHSNVYVADQLFATLDPTTRRIDLPSGQGVLFTDTVGFIQKLPTSLIAAFRATLEEIAEADILLHVVDVSHPNYSAHVESVEDTLAEIDVPDIPRILVWNKIDRIPGYSEPEIPLLDEYERQIGVSAKEQVGIAELLDTIEQTLQRGFCEMRVSIPYQQGEVVSTLFDVAQVIDQQHTPTGVVLTLQIPVYLYEKYRSFEIIEE